MPSNYVDVIPLAHHVMSEATSERMKSYSSLKGRNEVIGTITPTSLRVTLKIRCRKDLEKIRVIRKWGLVLPPLPSRVSLKTRCPKDLEKIWLASKRELLKKILRSELATEGSK